KDVIAQNAILSSTPSSNVSFSPHGPPPSSVSSSLRPAGSPRGLSSDISSRFFRKDHYTPNLIVRQSHMRCSEHINDTSSYVNLLQYSVFLIFYCIVLFRQIDNSGSREVKATLLDNLFSGGGVIEDWTMVGDHSDASSLSQFSYDGALVDPLTNGDPMTYFAPGSSYLSWFKHDILNAVFSPSYKGTQFLDGYEVVGGSLVGFGTRPVVILDNFPVIFPRTLDRERVNKISLLLDDNYVDEYTTSLTTSMVLFNRKNDIFSFVKVSGTKVDNSIRWKLKTNVYTIDPVVYSTDGKDVSRTIMEFLYLMSLFLLIVRELFELRQAIRHNGNIAGTLIYATNFGNIIDCGNYAVQVISNVAWLNFALMAKGWEPKLEYEVFEDPDGPHAYFKAGDGLLDCVQVMNDVTEFSKARTLHKTMASISLVLCCIQMVKNLDFHPRMGLITRTISHAAGPIVGVSIEYLFFMLLGEFFDTREGMNEAESSVSVLFFWTFMMICYFILINAFLAIIVEAYEQTKSGFDAISYTDALWSVVEKVNIWRKKTGGEYHLNSYAIQEVLNWVLGVYDEDMKEGDIPKLIQDTSRWDNVDLKDIPNAGRAVVIRKRDGDNSEDGTVTETGERIFFSQSHLFRALTNAHEDPKNHNPNAISNEKLAMAISYNILVRFGMVADVDADGEITNSEILSLKADARHGGNALNFATVALASKAKQLAAQADALTTSVIGDNGLEGGARRLSNFGGNILTGVDGVTGGFGGTAVGGLGKIGGGLRGSIVGGVGMLGHGMEEGIGNIGSMFGGGGGGGAKKVEEGRQRRQTVGGEMRSAGAAAGAAAGVVDGREDSDEEYSDTIVEHNDDKIEKEEGKEADAGGLLPGAIGSPGGDVEMGEMGSRT
ncbi:hypothetical protein TrRE_jg11734, partial [Triparma retinervis]